MPSGRVAVIGSSDTVLGLAVLGVDGVVAASSGEALAAARALRADGDVALLLVEHTLAEAVRGAIEAPPLIVEIPGPGGRIELEERVRRAVLMAGGR
jgi:vacuolar-type H+-ATPase subunit F/Vma7